MKKTPPVPTGNRARDLQVSSQVRGAGEGRQLLRGHFEVLYMLSYRFTVTCEQTILQLESLRWTTTAQHWTAECSKPVRDITPKIGQGADLLMRSEEQNSVELSERHSLSLGQLTYSSPMASLVLTDSSQLTSDCQNLGGRDLFYETDVLDHVRTERKKPSSVAKLANALVVLSSTAEDGEIEFQGAGPFYSAKRRRRKLCTICNEEERHPWSLGRWLGRHA
uniref:(California timema) hypothetical protein n=1 Tax=Timema californicum TaxID=61474 RepID=A0A7R9P9K7_TIMCA|nr:unnamed protein product [Timema californicum]